MFLLLGYWSHSCKIWGNWKSYRNLQESYPYWPKRSSGTLAPPPLNHYLHVLLWVKRSGNMVPKHDSGTNLFLTWQDINSTLALIIILAKKEKLLYIVYIGSVRLDWTLHCSGWNIVREKHCFGWKKKATSQPNTLVVSLLPAQSTGLPAILLGYASYIKWFCSSIKPSH